MTTELPPAVQMMMSACDVMNEEMRKGNTNSLAAVHDVRSDVTIGVTLTSP